MQVEIESGSRTNPNRQGHDTTRKRKGTHLSAQYRPRLLFLSRSARWSMSIRML